MTKTVDILGFNAVKDSEQGFILSMKNGDGTDAGIAFNVLGKHANAVQTWSKKVFSKMQREEAMAKKRGKDLEPTDIDELKEQTLEGALVRIIGWENVTQPFDKAILKQALVNNPHWIDQVLEASNDDANFTKPN